LLQTRIDIDAPTPLVAGGAAAVVLANLELGPPGCDPRRRAFVLEELDGVLGEDAALDAAGLAGWSLLASDEVDRARAAFERVVLARPDDLAAWEGLRSCGEHVDDKLLQAGAAAELGARCADDARGAAFWEEAALLCLASNDGENADRALEASFARDPRRGVAFDKLFRRTRDRKDNERLLAIIARRLEVTDQANEIQKLFWEQARVLREVGDQEGALKALEHVTMIDPDHVGALALLGEINIRRGHYADAAEALARLATLDAAPAKNRVTAGVAAVDLYENKLRRYDRALEVLLTLHNAGLSTLPVRERLAKTAARTADWGVATAALEQLMMERADPAGRIEAARLAMAIHRDRQQNPQGAILAITKLLEDSPMDAEALDLLLHTQHPPQVRAPLLENARAALLDHLQRKPADAENVLRLAEVARARGEDGIEQAALGTLGALGGGDTVTEQAFARLAARKPRIPQVAIPSSMMRAILAPGDEGPIADLFALLGPTIADALGPNLQASGVGKRDRIDPRSGVALRNEIAAWAGAFGIQEFELYVGGKDPLTVQGVPGEPPALVVGAGVNAPLAPLTRARVARELLGISRGTTIVRWRDDVTMASIVVAACRIADVRFEHPTYAVLAEVERLMSRAISRRTRRLLPPVCGAIASQRPDARAWSRRALASQDRIATIASGDPGVVLSDVLGVSLDRLGHAVPGNARAEELLRFVLSQAYVDLRQALGLEGAG
jgi:tetratricopeptide (TPR) repeat protein